MAVKWAVANGNWNVGATWNGGTIPQVGDYVYLNNHYVTVNSNVNIGSGHISNDINPNTGLSGGVILYTATCTITANIVCRYAKMFTQYAQSVSITIVGNIVGIGGADEDIFFSEYGLPTTTSVNGNVDAGVMNIFNKPSPSAIMAYFVINGNVTARTFVKAAIGFSLIVNGNAEVLRIKSVETNSHVGNIAITNLHMSSNDNVADISVGSLKCINCTLVTTNLSVGSIEYSSTTNSVGVRYTTLNILNPDTFTWKDVSEPRSNPFIILTDAEMNNRQQYPSEDAVKEGVEYVWGEKVGTYRQPPESVVLKGYVYDNGDKIGSLENQNIVGCVTKEDVREGVELIGLQEVGTLVVPDADDVREGVVFDNGTIGTLIVQGGGDRLRIADFGYYTNAQSDTYIVDLTEQDKPKFAVAEERVLIEMFPELDLNNIPEKYFDDLFVKYLKYRLIVEYYRTAGINSTFTPSEPTTEIVNYQNVRNEVWLNSANIYLKAWSKKYPESITKPQRILL